MATSIHPSLSCPLPFYTIPIFPLFNRNIFHLYTCLLTFFGCTLHITFLFYTLKNILPEAICCCFFMGIVLCMYIHVCQRSLLQVPVMWTDCLRLCVVVYKLILLNVLLVMYCMCVPAFIVTSAVLNEEEEEEVFRSLPLAVCRAKSSLCRRAKQQQ